MKKGKEKCETCVWWDEDLYCLKITIPHEKPHCQNGNCIYYVEVKNKGEYYGE